jgi:hypothetical protein
LSVIQFLTLKIYSQQTADTNELNSDYQVNQRVYCSICARRGHFAESCNQFLKTISGLITSRTIKIISHKPSCPRIYLNSFETAAIKLDEQLLALFTFFPFYRFNFQFSRIVRLYPRFVESFKSHKERVGAAANQRAIESAPRSENVFKSPESPETSFEKAIKAVTQTIVGMEPTKLVKNPFAVKLPEFIPLSSDENIPRPVQIERTPEVIGDAKLMITNDHSKLLMNKKGRTFLSDLQSRLKIIAQFKWDRIGNSLIITGIPSNQSMFHLEVREYLFRMELMQYEKILEKSSNLPKNKVCIVHVLKKNLQLMNRLKTFAVKKHARLDDFGRKDDGLQEDTQVPQSPQHRLHWTRGAM